MAYMNQERKKNLAGILKDALKDINLKYSLSVQGHSTIVMKIKSGSVDFFGERVQEKWSCLDQSYISVNPYWFQDHFSGTSREVLTKIFGALNTGNHDRSDVMTDYFDVGWYVEVKIGDYQKPYILNR